VGSTNALLGFAHLFGLGVAAAIASIQAHRPKNPEGTTYEAGVVCYSNQIAEFPKTV
jgi:hypothetical protein